VSQGAARDALERHLGALRADPRPLLHWTRDRHGGARVKAMRDGALFTASAGRCVVCEQPITRIQGEPNSIEIGHLIPARAYPSGKSRSGYVAGNLAAMCRSCNSAASDFPWDKHLDMIRCDWVPLTLTCTRQAGPRMNTYREAAFNIRKSKGLPF